MLAEHGPRRVGRKAMAVNLSDIAAMGGKPVAAFVSVGLPVDAAESVGKELYLGMREVADAFETVIAGGDTNTWNGGLVVSVTLSSASRGRRGRSCAAAPEPGDWLIRHRSARRQHPGQAPRLHAARPRRAAFASNTPRMHAMIDISDGLSADVFHICEESGCGAVLFAERNPDQRRRPATWRRQNAARARAQRRRGLRARLRRRCCRR